MKHATRNRQTKYRRFDFQPRYYERAESEFEYRLQEFQRERREKDDTESIVKMRAKRRDEQAKKNRLLRLLGILVVFGYLIFKLGHSFVPFWGEINVLNSQPMSEAIATSILVLGLAGLAKTFIKTSRIR